MTAEVHPRDGLLAGVAALREGDGVQLLEVRLLRQRRLVDVDAPFRTTSFDARDLPRLQPTWRGLRRECPFPEHVVRCRGCEELESLQLEIGNARDHDLGPLEL